MEPFRFETVGSSWGVSPGKRAKDAIAKAREIKARFDEAKKAPVVRLAIYIYGAIKLYLAQSADGSIDSVTEVIDLVGEVVDDFTGVDVSNLIVPPEVLAKLAFRLGLFEPEIIVGEDSMIVVRVEKVWLTDP